MIDPNLGNGNPVRQPAETVLVGVEDETVFLQYSLNEVREPARSPDR